MIRLSLLLASCCVFFITLRAQTSPFRFEHLGVDEGLSQSTIFSIYQDQQGFLWIGTGDGLNRYDGYSFTVFRNDPLDSASIPDNTIFAITADSTGNLWIGTESGLTYCDTRTLRFHRLAAEKRYAGTPLGKIVTSLLFDRSGRLWIGSSAGLSRLDLHTGTLDVFPSFSMSRLRVFAVQPIWLDHNGDVWVRHEGGFAVYRGATQQFHEEALPTRVVLGNPTAVFRDRSGTLWVGTSEGGLFEYANGKWTIYRHDPLDARSISANAISFIIEDDDGRLWVGTESGGLNYFERHASTFRRFIPDSNKPLQRFHETTTALIDRSGLLFVGHDGAGILKINPHHNKFQTLTFPTSAKNPGDNFFKSVLIDRHTRLWAGTFDRGLKVLALGNGQLSTFLHNPADPHSIGSNSIHSFLEDRTGSIWIGEENGIDVIRNFKSGYRNIPIPVVDSSFGHSTITRSIVEDAKGTLWAGGSHGLFRIDPDDLSASRFPLIDAQSGKEILVPIESLLPDGSAGMWIGSYGKGLLHLSEGVIEPVGPSPIRSTYTGSDVIKSIHAEGDSVLWVGTEQGLGRFQIRRKTWRMYFQRDGLPNDFIYGILSDSKGRLWLSTNRGLSRANIHDPDHPQFRNYTTEDGLQSSEFNSGVYFRAPDGRMVFGGVSGLNMFFPDSIHDNPVVPHVVITGFKKFDQPVTLPVDVAALDEITLAYDDWVFSFEFAGLEYSNSSLNTYAYKLEGFDPTWVYCGTRREARYTHLDPGSYTFEVKAANSDGVWNQQAAKVRIIVPPPFWMTTWFRLVAGGTLFLALTFSVRYVSTRKLRRRLRELEVLERVREERERISSELHDHIGANLTNIATGLEVSQRYASQRSTARLRENLSHLEDHARSTIQGLRDTIWSLQHESGSAGSLMQKIEDFLEDCRELQTGHMIRHSFEGDRGFMLSPTQSLNLYRICQEAVNNAFKHACANEVSVDVKVTKNELVIKVSDDGKGFDVSEIESQTGYGLPNMKRRASRVGAECEIRSGHDEGAVVEVTLHR